MVTAWLTNKETGDAVNVNHVMAIEVRKQSNGLGWEAVAVTTVEYEVILSRFDSESDAKRAVAKIVEFVSGVPEVAVS
jgi:hypothetical protein